MDTTFGGEPEAVTVLNELIEIEYDAAAAYHVAIERLLDDESARHLREFQGDHFHHTRDLGEVVRELGGHPTPSGRARTPLSRGSAVLASLPDDLDILRAMKSNEDEALRAYERAMERPDIPAEVADLLRTQTEHERAHRTWIARRIRELQHRPNGGDGS